MSIFDDFDATYGAGTYSAIPDGVGGMDIFHEGAVVDHMDEHGDFDSHEHGLTVPNVQGGTDTIIDGHVAVHTEPNVHGGTDVYHDGELVHTTIPNAMGGEDIFDGDMHMDGMTLPNVLGGEDMLAFGEHGDNTDEIMGYDDPLLHAAQYHMMPLTL